MPLGWRPNGGSITVKNNIITDATLGPFAVLLKNDSSGTLDAIVQGNTVTNMQLVSLNHDDMGSAGRPTARAAC